MENVVFYLKEYLYYVLIGWVVIYFLMRRFVDPPASRYKAVIYQTLIIFVLFSSALIIYDRGLASQWIWLPLIISSVVMYYFRNHFFPYSGVCKNCGEKLTTKEIFTQELCQKCKSKD
jgi:hypothetical protein